jgi:hypothetical protein
MVDLKKRIPILITRSAQLVSWSWLLAITILSLVPPTARPGSGTPHNFEHFGAFFVAGAAFAVGYRLKIVKFFAFAVIYCGVLELSQNLSPGRHARLSDFLVDSLSSCAGIALIALARYGWFRVSRTITRRPS